MCVTACARAPVQETQGCSGRGEVSVASINSLRINIQCRGFVSHGLKVSSNSSIPCHKLYDFALFFSCLIPESE